MDNSQVVSEFTSIIRSHGIHAGLRYLNARTPHRFTGVYRYDGETLRNVALFDQFNPDAKTGGDVAMADAYCATVGQEGRGVEFDDVQTSGRVPVRPGSPVISYCGALIRDAAGEPFGTLCHYDVKPCDFKRSDMPLLEALAPLIHEAVERDAATA